MNWKENYWGVSKIPTQTSLRDSVAVKKIGKWTIEIFTNPAGHKEIVACDGYNTYYAIIYDHNKQAAWDHPYYIPEGVKKWVREHAKELYDMMARDEMDPTNEIMDSFW